MDKKFKLNGYIIINKPAGITSAKVVSKVKKLLNSGEKIGHTGTLDPNVTGVLPLAIGSATKSIPYLNKLNDSDKVYKASMIFGFETDTLDIWGNIIGNREVPKIDMQDVMSVMKGMINYYEQVPPMYSALKLNGKRLYELAREGIVVDRKPRRVHISEFRDVSLENNELKFTVYCSKGTYVRSLCSDLARRLGTFGVMNSLVRLKSSAFYIEDSTALDNINTIDDIQNYLIPLNDVFRFFPKINLNYENSFKLLNGIDIDLNRFLSYNKLGKSQNIFRIKYGDNCIAFAQKVDNERIICNSRFYNAYDLDYLG